MILLNRFHATLDTWDPAFVAALASRHRVVMFDSLGIGETGGHTPATVEATADFAARVIEAMELHSPAIFGWSLGGFVAQVLAITRPKLLGKLVLVGTMPPRGSAEAVWSQQWLEVASNPVPSSDLALSLMFTDSDASRSAGRASFGRMSARPAAVVSPTAMAAQARAIHPFADHEDGWYARLHEIIAPTFVANGDRDGIFPAIDSAVLDERSREVVWPSMRTAVTDFCSSASIVSPQTCWHSSATQTFERTPNPYNSRTRARMDRHMSGSRPRSKVPSTLASALGGTRRLLIGHPRIAHDGTPTRLVAR